MNKKFIILICTLFFSVNVRSQDTAIVDIIKKPITYNEERIKLSLEYLKIRHGIIQSTPTISPKIIVMHYTAWLLLKLCKLPIAFSTA